MAARRRVSALGRRPALLSLGLLLAGATAAPGLPDWPTFRGDSSRLGRGDRPIGDRPAIAWKAGLGGSVDGSPVAAGVVVYVGTSHGVFAALDAADGQVRWRADLEGAICSAAALAGERVLIGTSRRFLYCLDPSGKVLWRAHAWDAVVGSPLVLGDVCYWGSMDGVMHATRLADGSVAWEAQLSGGVSSAASSDGERLYVGDEGGTVWALAPADGKAVWKVETGCPAMAAPVVSEGRVVAPLVSPTRLVPPEVPYLLALQAATGAELWRVTGARSVFASPVVAPGGVAYVSVEGYLSDTVLRGMTTDGRRETYARPVGGVVDSSAAWCEDVAYFGAQDGCLYATRISTGEVLSRVRLAPKIFSSPALDGGSLYIGASDGRLYCLR